MRNAIAAFLAASLLIVIAAPGVQATPTSVNVRIEGKSETLFERTIPVDVHGIKASSDTLERRCDGINVNDPWNVTPAVTPTLASVDAMASIGETFDGQWYEGYEDYFLTRWGPDAQDLASGAYWGLLVNEVFTNVGGCQYQLDDGDEVLWAYDAFKGRPSLALFPEEAHYISGPRPQSAIAQLGKPFPVEVVSYADDEEAVPGEEPSRVGTAPYAGAEVAPVSTNAEGFAKVEVASPQTVVTDSAGKASIVFDEPGVHRIKATRLSGGEEMAIRSNSLVVCVHAVLGDCGEVAPSSPPAPNSPARTPAAATRISVPKLDRKQISQGKIRVSWKVLDAGAGIRRWRISAKALRRKGARFLSKATGKTQTSATIRLAPGATYKLRLTLTDVAGHDTDYGLGKVAVPRAAQS
jgi:Domain of unknown function (DUF4430)